MAKYIKWTEWLRAINGVQGDHTKFINIFDDINEVKESDWFKNHKTFDNLNNIKDSELGTQQPILQYSVEGVYMITDERYIGDYDDSECFITIVDNTRETIIYPSVDTPIQIKPSENIEFNRIAYIINYSKNSNILVESKTVKDHRGIELYNPFNSQVYCRAINNGTISDVPLITECDGVIINDLVQPMSVYNRKADLINPVAAYNFPINNADSGTLQIYNATINMNGKNESNVWVFDNNTDCDNYLRTGDYSTAINFHDDYIPPSEEDDVENVRYYVHSREWEREKATEGEKTYTVDHHTRIILKNDIHRPFTLLVNEDTQIMHLNISSRVSEEDIIDILESSDNGETWHKVTLDTFHNNWWRYTKIIKENNKYIGAECYTNIPIFDNSLKSNLYFSGLIDESNALNPTENSIKSIVDKIIDIGNGIKVKNDLNFQTIRSDMSEIILGNSAFFGELASLFNDSDIVTQMKQGLLMHENPYEVFIDFFALPFQLENIVEVSTSQNTLDFGTYTHTFTQSFKRIQGAKEILMCSTDINNIYNDWRDYQCNIYLYLPYVNYIPLDTADFMGRNLKVTFVFDVASATIKYYIKANNITIFTVEGSVRVGLPLSASNNTQGFMQKLGGASQVIQAVQGFQNTKLSVAKGALSAMSGNVEGAIDDIANVPYQQFKNTTDLIGGVADILRPTPKQYSGNYSSSCAFYDELNAYLIIEQANLMYDDNIKQQYNLPDNRVSTLNTCTGYTELDNIDLQVNTSEDIRQEILEILYSGVYC